MTFLHKTTLVVSAVILRSPDLLRLNSNYFTLRDTNLNLFALKLHDLYSTKRNPDQFKTNIFSDGTKWNLIN